MPWFSTSLVHERPCNYVRSVKGPCLQWWKNATTHSMWRNDRKCKNKSNCSRLILSHSVSDTESVSMSWGHPVMHQCIMMTSSNGNTSRVTGLLCGEFTGDHKGQWRGTLMFSWIYAWTKDWLNNRDPGDLRRHLAHYDVIAMIWYQVTYIRNMTLWLDACKLTHGVILEMARGESCGIIMKLNPYNTWISNFYVL